MTDQAPSATKLIPFAKTTLEAFLPPTIGDWRRVSTARPLIDTGRWPEPALEVFVGAYARYIRDGASVEVTVTDLVEVGMSSVTAPPPLTTVVNEFGTTTFSRRDGRLLSQRIDPQGKGSASIMAANGVGVSAEGRGEDMTQLVELIARIDLPRIDRLERPALPSVANEAVDGLSQAIVAMAQAEWARLDPAVDTALGWELRISPPIPAAWPVSEGTTFTWYLYAAARVPQLKDGERIAVPWGRIEHRTASSDAPVLVRAMAGVAPLGTQGVKPLAATDSARLDACTPEALHRSLVALATTWVGNEALMADTLESYRIWQRLNGVLANAVLPQHAAFAKALRQR